MTDRGERRAQKERNRARWLRYWRTSISASDAGWLKRTVQRSANHGTLCSCWMCGNARKWFGQKTLQEMKADEAERLDR